MENRLIEFPPPVPACIQRPPLKLFIDLQFSHDCSTLLDLYKVKDSIYIDGGFQHTSYSNIYNPNWEGYKRNKRDK